LPDHRECSRAAGPAGPALPGSDESGPRRGDEAGEERPGPVGDRGLTPDRPDGMADPDRDVSPTARAVRPQSLTVHPIGLARGLNGFVRIRTQPGSPAHSAVQHPGRGGLRSGGPACTSGAARSGPPSPPSFRMPNSTCRNTNLPVRGVITRTTDLRCHVVSAPPD